MQEKRLSSFEKLLVESQNELGTSVLLILAWLAASDGNIDSSEKERLREISENSKHGGDISSIIEIAKSGDIEALHLACEIVKPNFKQDKARLFMEMAIGMAIADLYLVPSENHIIRFIADFLGINKSELNKIFIETTGKEIPEPADPSNAKFWESRDNTKKESSEKKSYSHDNNRDLNEEKINAYAILGLTPGADSAEIKAAYRRLAQIHHPDRFSSLGDEAVAAATSTFQRIKKAYNYLMKDA